MYKLRITYTKSKDSIYIPNDEVISLFDRAFLRQNINIINIKENIPYIISALPLPIGIESTSEVIEILIEEHVDETFLIKMLNQELPQGMVVLAVKYISNDEVSIDKVVEKVVYEITPNLRKDNMTNGEYEEKRLWYRAKLKEYLDESAILVLVKSESRNERIDIKPNIKDYQILINDALRVTVGTKTEYMFSPTYIMDGFEETVNEKIDYVIKRVKIIYR